MNEAKLDRQVQYKILEEIGHGDITTLTEVKAKNPNFHWNSIWHPKTGDTALHIAAQLSHLTVIDYLLQEFNPCTVDVKKNNNNTPLHEAARLAQLDSVLKLCSNGADVNALSRGDWTPLMFACTNIKPEVSLLIVRELVSRGANVNARNEDGWSCVHILAREGGEDIFDFLIDNGLQIGLLNNEEQTALHIACIHANKDMVAKVLRYCK